MNFNQLRAFYEVAKSRSFKEAADRLCVSQPAVTAQIKALEDQIGMKIFSRRGRQLVLTQCGSSILQHVQDIFEKEEEIERIIRETQKVRRGTLKVGTTILYARYLFSHLVPSFHETYPNVKILVEEGSSTEMVRSVAAFRNEIAVAAKTEMLRNVEFVPFRKEKLVLFAANNHPFANREHIRFDELRDQNMIMKQKGSGTALTVEQTFFRRGMTPTTNVELSNLESIIEMVEKGEGVAFLAEMAVKGAAEEGRVKIIPIQDQELFMLTYVVIIREDYLSPVAKVFFNFLSRDELRALQ